MSELSKSYEAKSVQDEVQQAWDAKRLWHAEPDPTKPPYVIVIPPPNVTGALHLGHALNNTIQDILVRWKRMSGFNAVWIPGTDHAGIATQSVVEKRVQQEQGKRRTDFTRDAFVQIIQKWKDEYEARILGQLRAMGSSCDWDRTAFTMDEPRSRAVNEAFYRLFRDGLIYRGKRLVNWDPVTQTSLADDEVENEEVDGFFYYLKYPLADGSGHVTVATTRPETMLGDTAVAVNPKDPRAASLRGKSVRLPIVDRVIPIIEDDYVVLPIAHGGDKADAKAQFSSGFLKVTPAHDPNDYALGQKYKLAMINVMAPDAGISLDHGWSAIEPHQSDNPTLRPFVGLSREAARAQIIEHFKQQGLLEAQKPYRHTVGHSYRSHVPIEPYLSDQWYINVTKPVPGFADESLAGLALSAVRREQDRLRLVPERYEKTYDTWNANLRDWCISRQLWWGHRIPVWVVRAEVSEQQITAALAGIEHSIIRSADSTYVCIRNTNMNADARLVPLGFVQDEDVLDTWFSSALWPLSTLGWPDQSPAAMKTLDTWNPTSTLCTAREIITLWVSRMVMFNRYLRGTDQTAAAGSTRSTPLPFRDVFIHAMIQDGHGQKMSKSYGNGVDPADVIRTHGTDAMRFTLCSMTTHTQDARMPVDMIDPHTGETFTPKYFVNKSGITVAEPIQEFKGKRCISTYGLFTGEARPTADLPAAANTSAKFDLGRNFCNKLWNAARFVLMQIGSAKASTDIDESTWSTIDRWILSRLARTVQACNAALSDYRFDQYAKACYDFVWRDFCDWYLEASKPAMRDERRRQSTAQILATCLDMSLRLMHPIIPFITEMLYWALNETMPARGIDVRFPCPTTPHCMTARFPMFDDEMDKLTSGGAERVVERLQEIVAAIREVRNSQKIDLKKKLPITIQASADVVHHVLGNREFIEGLATCSIVDAGPESKEPANSAKTTAAGVTIFVGDVVDAASSEKRKAELARKIATLKGRLGNESYIAKAPAKLVQETKDELATAEAELAKL
jgi:valyl-tRNA synthetase